MRRLHRRLAAPVVLALVVVGQVATPSSAEHTNYTLDVEPEIDRNPLGGLHVLKATVTPASALPQLEVHFEIVSGPNAEQKGEISPNVAVFTEPDDTCVIAAGGTSCEITIRDTRAPTGGSTDTIVAWVDHDPTIAVDAENLDKDESHDAGEPPHGPGVPTGSEGSTPEPDSTDVVIKHWGQMRVGSIPFTDGELELASDPDCNRSRERTRSGRVIAAASACNLLFAIDPATDGDPDMDHYVSWVQGGGKTKGEWCSTRFSVTAHIPSSSTPVSFATTSEGRIRNKNRLRKTEMFVDAGGNSSSPSYLLDLYFLAKGKVEVYPRAKRVKTAWRGNTKRNLAMSTGWAFSVPQGSPTPMLEDPSDIVLAVERNSC